jgi:rhodanese-related sulfurtransferase
MPVRTLLIFSALIFLWVTLPARAEEALKSPVTISQFKAALPAENEKELDLEGFRALQKEGSVTVLDLRSPEHFARFHLKGSINAPLTELTEKTLPGFAPGKDAPVVLVCDYSFQPVRMLAMTMQAYPVLRASGYSRVYRLNLWHGVGRAMSLEDEQKLLPFEGTDMKPVVR